MLLRVNLYIKILKCVFLCLTFLGFLRLYYGKLAGTPKKQNSDKSLQQMMFFEVHFYDKSSNTISMTLYSWGSLGPATVKQ